MKTNVNIIKNSPIGVLDSGIGGISTLNILKKVLPNEDFIFYADHKFAPYGDKTVEEVKSIVWNIVDYFSEQNVKAIVLACNTATSAVAKELREKLTIPILGLEPAIKPALEKSKKDIIIMATVLTLEGKKFSDLLNKITQKNSFLNNKLIKLPAKGLVELIEAPIFDKKTILLYLTTLFRDINLDNYSYLILGCTHYIFVKDEIKQLVGNKIKIIDGNMGVSLYLKKILVEKDIISSRKRKGNIQIISSGSNKDLRRCYRFLD